MKTLEEVAEEYAQKHPGESELDRVRIPFHRYWAFIEGAQWAKSKACFCLDHTIPDEPVASKATRSDE